MQSPNRPSPHYKQWLYNNLLDIAYHYTLSPKQTLTNIKATSNEVGLYKLMLPKLHIMHEKNKELIHINNEKQQILNTIHLNNLKRNLVIKELVCMSEELDIPALIEKVEELASTMIITILPSPYRG